MNNNFRKMIVLMTFTFIVGVMRSQEKYAGLVKNSEHPSVYWTDSITERPDGYRIDELGNVSILTNEGLAWFISCVNGLNGQQPDNFEDKIVILDEEVDMAGALWTPIGTEEHPFKGTFDGNYFRILNMDFCNEPFSDHHIGMFGLINSAEVRNVTLDGGVLVGSTYVGGIAGVSENNSLIDNCRVALHIDGENYVGGVVGLNIDSRIYNCNYTDEELDFCGYYCGMIAGSNKAEAYEAIIANCYSAAYIPVTYIYRANVGGIVGSNLSDEEGPDAIISNCYSVPVGVDCCYEYGAIVAYNKGVVTNCYYSLPTGEIPMYYRNDGIFENNSYFSWNTGTEAWEFPSPVMVGEDEFVGLVDALNAWCLMQSDMYYYSWRVEGTDYPIFTGVKVVPNQTEEMKEEKYSIFPNPAQANFTIKGIEGNYSYTLFNAMGQLVKTGTAYGEKQINVEGMAKGVYMLKVSTEMGVETQRVVVK